MKIDVEFVLNDGTAVSETANSPSEIDSMFEKVALRLKSSGVDLDICNDVFDGRVRSLRIWFEA